VLTTAIVDRLIHHAVILNIIGPSYRIHESKRLNAELAARIKPPTETPAPAAGPRKPRAAKANTPIG
jgi:hypothetical protein